LPGPRAVGFAGGGGTCRGSQPPCYPPAVMPAEPYRVRTSGACRPGVVGSRPQRHAIGAGHATGDDYVRHGGNAHCPLHHLVSKVIACHTKQVHVVQGNGLLGFRSVGENCMIRTAAQAPLEWEGSGLPEAPSAPESLKESGLSLGFLCDLI